MKIVPFRTYLYLEDRPDKRSQELFIRGTNIRASTILHDMIAWRRSEEQIAADRDLPIEAIYEALQYCKDAAELIDRELEEEEAELEQELARLPPR